MMTMKELRDRTPAELHKLLNEYRTELASTAIKVSGNQEKHVHKLSELKRSIARVLTVLNQSHD